MGCKAIFTLLNSLSYICYHMFWQGTNDDPDDRRHKAIFNS
jgi:hypothetical protein